MRNLPRLLTALVAAFLCFSGPLFAAVPADIGWQRPMKVEKKDWLTGICSKLIAAGDTTPALVLSWRDKISKSPVWQNANWYRGFNARQPMHLCVANAWLDKYGNFDRIADAALIVRDGDVFRFPITREAANKTVELKAWITDPRVDPLTAKVAQLTQQLDDANAALSASQGRINSEQTRAIDKLRFDLDTARARIAALESSTNVDADRIKALEQALITANDNIRNVIEGNTMLSRNLDSATQSLADEKASHAREVAVLKQQLAEANARLEQIGFVGTIILSVKERLMQNTWTKDHVVAYSNAILGGLLLFLVLIGFLFGIMRKKGSDTVAVAAPVSDGDSPEDTARYVSLLKELSTAREEAATAQLARAQAEQAVQDLLEANVAGADFVLETPPFDSVDLVELGAGRIEVCDGYVPILVKWHTLVNRDKKPNLKRYQLPDGLKKGGQYVPFSEFMRILAADDAWCAAHHLSVLTQSKQKQQAA